MFSFISYILILFLLPLLSFAEPICSNLNFKETVMCLAAKHPESKKNSLFFSESDGVKKAGRSLQNPELSFETLQGRGLSGRTGTNRVAVSYPFEIFGQRAARIEKANAESDLLQIEGLKGTNRLVAAVALSLYRLKHIKEEISILDDALGTYANVISQLSARKVLGPDQDVTLGVFKLAVGDLSFKKSMLVVEGKKIYDFFSHIPELQTVQVDKMLPDHRKNWPKITPKNSELSGWPIKQVESQLKLAEAEYNVTKAAAWPELKAGIIYDQAIDGALQNSQVGFGLTLPIPLLNWNAGNKQIAASAFQRAKVDRELAQVEVVNERTRTIEFYNSSVDTLKKSPNETEVVRRTKNLASKYSRGLITSSLLIEAHRQLFDFTTSQNEIERQTLESILKVYELDGVSVEEAL